MKICKHKFELISERLVDTGRNKEFVFRCKDCKKEVVRLLDGKNKLPKYGIRF